MLPGPDYFPTGFAQALRLPGITFLVLGEFRQPVVLVGLREGRVLGTTMPETAIHEYRDLWARKDDIDRDPFYPPVQPEAKASSMESRPKCQFGPGALLLHAFHDL